MPATALGFALAAAFLHAFWNLLLARARDPEGATAVALVASVVVFAPVAAFVWKAEASVWPFIAATSLLQLLYFALLATAYAKSELSIVYPIARGTAPVLVLVVGVVALGVGASAAQAAGVCLVGLGVILVRGFRGRADLAGTGFALAIAATIAAYTLVDKHGIVHAGPVTYLELGMIPASLGYVGVLIARRGTGPIRAELRVAPIVAGITSFGAYVLVLAALARASAASVAAVRETSVVIATAAAVPVLRERVGWGRLAGAAVVVAGVALVSLGTDQRQLVAWSAKRFRDRFRWCEPSASMTNTWGRPVRSLVKRIFEPSGDQAGGLVGVSAVREPSLVAAVGVDRVDRGITGPVCCVAGEEDASVARPGGGLLELSRSRQAKQPGPVRADDEEVAVARGRGRVEHQPCPVRRPARELAPRQPASRPAITTHDPDDRASPVAGSGRARIAQMDAVRRPLGVGFGGGRAGECPARRTVDADDLDVEIGIGALPGDAPSKATSVPSGESTGRFAFCGVR